MGVKGGVDVYGDYAIVGAFGDEENGGQSGAAYIYERCGSDWAEMQKIIPADNEALDRFGRGVSIWGDFAIIGCPYDDDMGANSGSAYIYQLINGVWEFDQKLIAMDGSASDWYGWTVSIWEDYAIVGAQNDYGVSAFTGSAFVYKREGGQWNFQSKLLASDPGIFDKFGLSLNIKDGFAIVGAYEKDGVGEDSGAAYVFRNDNDVWSFMSKLTSSDISPGDNFGYDVEISDSLLMVSAPFKDTTTVNSGAVYVFELQPDSTWTEEQTIVSPENILAENFGISMDFDGDKMITGAIRGFGLSEETGAGYLFSKDNGTWNYEMKLFSDDGDHADFYANSVSIDNETVMCGAMGDDSNGGNAGSVYMYHVGCAPVCTKMISPAPGDTMFYANNIIEWAEVSMANGYEIGIGTTPGTDDVLGFQDIGDTTSFYTALDDQTEYFVSVIPYNDFGLGQACNSYSFTTDFIIVQGSLGDDIILSCDADIPVEVISYTDSCNNVTVNFSEEISEMECDGEYTILRTLVVTDECGSSTTYQEINIVDIDPPMIIDFMEVVEIDCGDSIPLEEPTAVDNCSDFTIDFTDTGSLDCGETIMRTFNVVDNCGNATSVVQSIVIGESVGAPNCATLASPVGDEVNLEEDLTWLAVIDADGYIVNAGTTPGGTDIANMVDVGNVLSYDAGNWPLASTIYVAITPYNGFGEAEDCIEAQFETILVGIDEISLNSEALVIYPNPSTNGEISFVIKGNQEILQKGQIEIYNIYGSRVSFTYQRGGSSNGDHSVYTISFNEASGNYLLHVNLDNARMKGTFNVIR